MTGSTRADSERRQYILLGTAAWDAPWLTDQNLGAALARQHDVLYVEPPISPLTPLRASRQPTVEAKKASWQRGVRFYDSVAVVQPLVAPPLSHRVAQRFSAPLLRAQIARARRLVGIERPVVLAFRPMPEIRGTLRERLWISVLKDWTPSGADLLGRPTESLTEDVAQMVRSSDHVIAISASLLERVQGSGVSSSLLRHGFHDDLAHAYGGDVPLDLGLLPRPLVGFAGRIDARLDIEGVIAIARAIAPGTVVLIGPVSPRMEAKDLGALRQESNIVFLGVRSRERLPAYLAHMDCLLIPYARSSWADHGSPLKLWDYLYAGPPIVGSGYRVLHDYAPDYVTVAGTSSGLASAVVEALGAPESGRAARRNFALQNTWQARARELNELVSRLLSGTDCSEVRGKSDGVRC